MFTWILYWFLSFSYSTFVQINAVVILVNVMTIIVLKYRRNWIAVRLRNLLNQTNTLPVKKRKSKTKAKAKQQTVRRNKQPSSEKIKKLPEMKATPRPKHPGCVEGEDSVNATLDEITWLSNADEGDGIRMMTSTPVYKQPRQRSSMAEKKSHYPSKRVTAGKQQQKPNRPICFQVQNKSPERCSRAANPQNNSPTNPEPNLIQRTPEVVRPVADEQYQSPPRIKQRETAEHSSTDPSTQDDNLKRNPNSVCAGLIGNTPSKFVSNSGSADLRKSVESSIWSNCTKDPSISSENLGSNKSELSTNLKRDSWIWFSSQHPANSGNFAARQDKFRSTDPRVRKLLAEITRQDQMNEDIKREADSLIETVPRKKCKPKSPKKIGYVQSQDTDLSEKRHFKEILPKKSKTKRIMQSPQRRTNKARKRSCDSNSPSPSRSPFGGSPVRRDKKPKGAQLPLSYSFVSPSHSKNHSSLSPSNMHYHRPKPECCWTPPAFDVAKPDYGNCHLERASPDRLSSNSLLVNSSVSDLGNSSINIKMDSYRNQHKKPTVSLTFQNNISQKRNTSPPKSVRMRPSDTNDASLRKNMSDQHAYHVSLHIDGNCPDYLTNYQSKDDNHLPREESESDSFVANRTSTETNCNRKNQIGQEVSRAVKSIIFDDSNTSSSVLPSKAPEKMDPIKSAPFKYDVQPTADKSTFTTSSNSTSPRSIRSNGSSSPTAAAALEKQDVLLPTPPKKAPSKKYVFSSRYYLSKQARSQSFQNSPKKCFSSGFCGRRADWMHRMDSPKGMRQSKSANRVHFQL